MSRRRTFRLHYLATRQDVWCNVSKIRKRRHYAQFSPFFCQFLKKVPKESRRGFSYKVYQVIAVTILRHTTASDCLRNAILFNFLTGNLITVRVSGSREKRNLCSWIRLTRTKFINLALNWGTNKTKRGKQRGYYEEREMKITKAPAIASTNIRKGNRNRHTALAIEFYEPRI